MAGPTTTALEQQIKALQESLAALTQAQERREAQAANSERTPFVRPDFIANTPSTVASALIYIANVHQYLKGATTWSNTLPPEILKPLQSFNIRFDGFLAAYSQGSKGDRDSSLTEVATNLRKTIKDHNLFVVDSQSVEMMSRQDTSSYISPLIEKLAKYVTSPVGHLIENVVDPEPLLEIWKGVDQAGFLDKLVGLTSLDTDLWKDIPELIPFAKMPLPDPLHSFVSSVDGWLGTTAPSNLSNHFLVKVVAAFVPATLIAVLQLNRVVTEVLLDDLKLNVVFTVSHELRELPDPLKGQSAGERLRSRVTDVGIVDIADLSKLCQTPAGLLLYLRQGRGNGLPTGSYPWVTRFIDMVTPLLVSSETLSRAIDTLSNAISTFETNLDRDLGEGSRDSIYKTMVHGMLLELLTQSYPMTENQRLAVTGLVHAAHRQTTSFSLSTLVQAKEENFVTIDRTGSSSSDSSLKQKVLNTFRVFHMRNTLGVSSAGGTSSNSSNNKRTFSSMSSEGDSSSSTPQSTAAAILAICKPAGSDPAATVHHSYIPNGKTYRIHNYHPTATGLSKIGAYGTDGEAWCTACGTIHPRSAHIQRYDTKAKKRRLIQENITDPVKARLQAHYPPNGSELAKLLSDAKVLPARHP